MAEDLHGRAEGTGVQQCRADRAEQKTTRLEQTEQEPTRADQTGQGLSWAEQKIIQTIIQSQNQRQHLDRQTVQGLTGTGNTDSSKSDSLVEPRRTDHSQSAPMAGSKQDESS